MLIECLLRRDRGTKAEVGGIIYHFKPLGGGPGAPHVCEVRSNAHIQRFLSIPEGYCISGGDEEVASDLPAPPVQEAQEAQEAQDVSDLPPGLKFEPDGHGVIAIDAHRQDVSETPQQDDEVSDDAKSGPSDEKNPQDDDVLRANLMAQNEGDLLECYGKKSSYGLNIDRRMRKENIVSVIIERGFGEIT